MSLEKDIKKFAWQSGIELTDTTAEIAADFIRQRVPSEEEINYGSSVSGNTETMNAIMFQAGAKWSITKILGE